MDFRLNFRQLLTCSILYIVVSCKTNKNLNTDLNHYYGTGFPHNKEVKYSKKDAEAMFWIWEFKQGVFYDCLFENYKSDSIYKIMKKEDLFNPSDYIPFAYWEK